MSQTTYPINQDAYLLGQIINTAYKHTEGKICKGVVPVGRGVSKVIGKDDQVRLPASNSGKLVFAGDLVTSNVVDMDINGVAITSVTFATDHATTMVALAVEIASNADVATAVVDPTDTTSRTIIVTGVDNTVIAITGIAVTAGATQTTGTFTADSADTLYGVAQLSQALEGGLPGTTSVPEYADKAVANIMRRGEIAVHFETAFNPDSDTLYCRFVAGSATELIGQFRNDSDSGKAYAVSGNVKVKTTLAAAGLGVLELNKPV